MQILIGGASGVAKSTQAIQICKNNNIVHKIGSGFIREIVRHFISQKSSPALHEYSFGTSKEYLEPYDLLREQSSQLVKPTLRCLERAKSEGTSIIIEGVNILPSLYSDFKTEKKYILYVENEKQHWEMINGDTHSNRVITKDQFLKVREIQESFKQDALKYNWQLVESVKEQISDFIK
jgi:2-phosphoglycerate kinase|tara:strand:- start:6135 stop:6671 length:537 start_codon:yes stop_codon:yes gene_type:complete